MSETIWQRKNIEIAWHFFNIYKILEKSVFDDCYHNKSPLPILRRNGPRDTFQPIKKNPDHELTMIGILYFFVRE